MLTALIHRMLWPVLIIVRNRSFVIGKERNPKFHEFAEH